MTKKRATDQKKVILKVLQESLEHLTADEVYKRSRKILSSIGVATVYRNLDEMVNQKLIDEVYVAGQPKWYEIKKGGYHGHTFCEKCLKLGEIASCCLCSTKNKLQQWDDFEGREWRFLIVGKCKKCLEKY